MARVTKVSKNTKIFVRELNISTLTNTRKGGEDDE